jgi:Flp pilus assembly protein TadG
LPWRYKGGRVRSPRNVQQSAAAVLLSNDTYSVMHTASRREIQQMTSRLCNWRFLQWTFRSQLNDPRSFNLTD